MHIFIKPPKLTPEFHLHTGSIRYAYSTRCRWTTSIHFGGLIVSYKHTLVIKKVEYLFITRQGVNKEGW